ncbi:THO complex subunit 4-B-like [Oppia nitens]|uniref:THO complex subunit 4-B-like n=1 Tax=Oppia nitens TaxID=1686743 RepID=UPI0023DA3561|nr:THO complex subunit 4-B-like [Oppia nitens]
MRHVLTNHKTYDYRLNYLTKIIIKLLLSSVKTSMTTMNNKLDLSLDEIIAREGITATKGNHKKGLKEMTTNNKFDKIEINITNDDNNVLKRKSHFADNLMAKKAVANDNRSAKNIHFNSSCGQIFIENLEFGVVDGDIHQLFDAFGSLKRAALNYDRNGRSAGTAFVVFERKADAITAVNSLNNVTLDGRVLRLTLVDGNSSSFDHKSGPRQSNFNARLKSQSNGSTVGTKAGDVWSNIAMNETVKSGHKKVIPTTDDLDADLAEYLAQRNATKE